MVVGPSAKQATAASVITVSEMSFMSAVDAAEGAALDRDDFGLLLYTTAHVAQHVHEAYVALQAFS